MCKISIIIPIFNAEKYLPVLFQKLNQCEFASGDEILMIDNGSTDLSLKLCKEKEIKNPKLYRSLSFTKKAGSYSARNFAVDQAKGDILVFTDSDCKPTKDWLTEIRKNIGKGTVIAGKIQIEIVNNGIWENFDSIAHLKSEKNAATNMVATANMAVRKEDFYKVGLFEERFSGGDYDWSIRAAQVGLKIKFVPEALVLHPSRKKFSEILIKEQRIAYGAGNHQKINGKSYIWLIIKYVLKLFKIDTNVRYTKELRKVGISNKELFMFNIKFMRIRFEQLIFAIKGYKQLDVRKIGIK